MIQDASFTMCPLTEFTNGSRSRSFHDSFETFSFFFNFGKSIYSEPDSQFKVSHLGVLSGDYRIVFCAGSHRKYDIFSGADC